MMADCGSINTVRGFHPTQRQLALSGQAVTDLAPVHEILAVVNGDPWKVLETTIDQVIVLTDAADARIGMKTGNDGIGVFHGKRVGEESVLGAIEDVVTESTVLGVMLSEAVKFLFSWEHPAVFIHVEADFINGNHFESRELPA